MADGDNYYHFVPFERFIYNSHVIIDENGFRNDKHNQKETDIVLLGDSLVFARQSDKDLGAFFRQSNLSAINLAMEGFAPQHYRDVYKSLIVNRDISHKHVIITFFEGNDFNDSMRYPWTLNFVGEGNANFPWTINLLKGLYNTRKNQFINRKITERDRQYVSLPYRKEPLNIDYLWWTPALEKNDESWAKVYEPIHEIVTLARQKNVKVTLVIMPSPSSVYGEKLNSNSFAIYAKSHKNIVNNFRLLFPNILVLDPNTFLSNAVSKKFIYIADSDAHFNTHGTQTYFNYLMDNLDL